MFSRVNPKVHIQDLHAHATKRVDKLVDDVDKDINEILGNDELELQNMYGSYFNESKGRNSQKSFDGVSTKSGRPATIIFNKIKVFDDDDDEDHADSPGNQEDVKFSHEMSKESREAQELRMKFDETANELEKIKFKYQKAKEHLKKFDNKVTELERTVGDKEDENAKLRSEIQSSAAAHRQTINVARLANNANNPQTNPALTQQVNDMNKRAEEIRKALLSDDNDQVQVSLEDLFRSKNFGVILYAWLRDRLTPFKRDVQQIQAKFGSSIASYFVFLRFVFLHMVIIGIVMAAFGILHLIKMYQRSTYIPNLFMNYDGYLPMFMRYKTWEPVEAIHYSVMVVFVLVFVLIVLCHKIVSEDRYIKDVTAVIEDNTSPYSKEVLSAWDFSLSTKVEVDDQCGSLAINYLQQLDATRTMGIKKQRTRYQIIALYARRTLGFYMYAYLLAVSTSSIVYLTINAQYIAKQANSNSILRNISSLITPLLLNLINAIVPVLLKYINKVEMWDTVQTDLNVALFRSYVSNTLNSIILALSYLLLSDPYLLADSPKLRNGIQLQTNVNYSCRIDQASDGLFTLMLFSWALNLVTMYATPLFTKIGHEYILRKVWIKSEFDTPDQMVKLLNFLGLVYMLFPFSPLAMLFVPCFLVINFKWEKYCVKHWYAKPKRIARGQSIGLVFTFFYLSTFILLGCTMGFYFLTSKTFAKDCSIQDDHVGLCDTDVVSELCTMNAGSKYYSYYKSDADKYPQVVCENACGPFIHVATNFTPLKDKLLGFYGIYLLWEILFVYPYLSWFLVIVLAIVIAVKVNSMDVLTYSSYNKEKEMEAHIATIEVERKRQEKTIKKLKQLSQAEEQKEE